MEEEKKNEVPVYFQGGSMALGSAGGEGNHDLEEKFNILF